MPTTAMLFLIISSLGLFALIFGLFYMQKRENLAMVEKGMNPKEYRPTPYKNLKAGLLMVGAGVGLFLAFMLENYTGLSRHNDPEALYFSLIAIGGGIGLISSYRIEKKELLDKKDS